MTQKRTDKGCQVMSDTKFLSTADNGVRSTFVDTGFESIQANLDAGGWSASVRQLQGGQLEIACRRAMHRDLAALDLRVSRTIEVSGVSPADRITVFASAGPVAGWLNARRIDAGRVVIVPPGFEVMSLFRGGSRIIVTQIPVSDRSASLPGAVGCSVAHSELANYIESVSAFVATPRGDARRDDRALEMLRNIRLLGHRPRDAASVEERLESKHRIIHGASEYIGLHIDESIRIREMSDRLTTSVSCLERTFRGELDMTPSQYILARRLVAANKKLKSAGTCRRADGTVARIAMDHGFTHLGRFSSAYRNHFGELPSETLAV